MGDNLLLMDSPLPSLKATGVTRRHANSDLASTQQTESPCGVDKLLNFSPSKLNEVNQVKFNPRFSPDKMCTLWK